MKITQLLSYTTQYPVFSLEDCQKWFPHTTRGTLIVQLSRYVAQGTLQRIRRGLFVIPLATSPLHPWVIASRLHEGAVVSLESVLQHEGMIPEVPFATVAVTATKTRRFIVPGIGTFLYRHLAPRLMFGWKLHAFPPYQVRVMEPEKALLDMLWFHRFEHDPLAYCEGLRLTIPRAFLWSKVIAHTVVYQNRFMDRMVKALKDVYYS